MEATRRERPAGDGRRGAENEHGKARTSKRNTPTPKIWRTIALLSTGERITRWDAARRIHDSCLNSTVSEIERRMNLKVARREIVVRGYADVATRCCEYWLEPKDREKAKAMLRARYGQEAEGAA